MKQIKLQFTTTSPLPTPRTQKFRTQKVKIRSAKGVDILINRNIDIAVYINNNGGGDYKDEE